MRTQASTLWLLLSATSLECTESTSLRAISDGASHQQPQHVQYDKPVEYVPREFQHQSILANLQAGEVEAGKSP